VKAPLPGFASALRRDELSIALVYCLSMISAQTRSAFVARENRSPPRIKCGAGFFRIMLRRTALRAANGSGARALFYR
jgi:hypothetical protein